MYIRHFILASIAFFVVTTSALPTPPAIALSQSKDTHLVSRRDETYDFNDLQRRLLTNQQVAQHAADTLRAQANKKAGNAPLPKTGPKLSSADRQQVNAALRTAGTNFKNTKNLPGKNDNFAVGGRQWSGKDVRKAVFNSHVFGSTAPVGRSQYGGSTFPKHFGNYPYAPTHPQAGQHIIPGAPTHGLTEFPLKSGSTTGWVGRGDAGAGRFVLSHTPGGRTRFQGVMGHNTQAGGTAGDHYLATHTPDYSGLDRLFQ